MHLFYTPDIRSNIYTLSEEESKHCIKVLRMKEGDAIYLVDGKGGFYHTQIVDTHPKKCVVEVLDLQLNYGARPYRLHMAISPLKFADRFEWFLEKATEIGIDEITPIITKRSEKKELKLDRANKIIESAMKQSVKAYHPIINEAISFSDFLKNDFSNTINMIAHCLEDEKKSIFEMKSQVANYLILIGPEGDFTEEEIQLAKSKKFEAVTLGKERLRTETAAISACVMFSAMSNL